MITGLIEPGTHINQQDLANDFNVSVTPVREALSNLQAQGILTFEHHRGAYVTITDRNTADQVYRARAVLEGLVIREAVQNIEEVHIQRLCHLADNVIPRAIEEGIKNHSFLDFRKANYEFHEMFAIVSNLHIIRDMITSLWARTPIPRDFFVVLQERAREAVEEHIRLMEAVKSHDSEEAGRCMEEHINNARQAYLTYLNRKNDKGDILPAH